MLQTSDRPSLNKTRIPATTSSVLRPCARAYWDARSGTVGALPVPLASAAAFYRCDLFGGCKRRSEGLEGAHRSLPRVANRGGLETVIRELPRSWRHRRSRGRDFGWTVGSSCWIMKSVGAPISRSYFLNTPVWCGNNTLGVKTCFPTFTYHLRWLTNLATYIAGSWHCPYHFCEKLPVDGTT